MDEKLSTERGGGPEWRKYLISAVILALLLSLAFALGFAFGREDNPPPILIETAER